METSGRRSLVARRRSGDPRRQNRTHARAEEFEEISKISPVSLYIPSLQCDQVEQLGGIEMQNRKRLLQLGVTEKFKSVAPRWKT